MAGHSKWENIKRKKAVVDAKRGKEFTKLSHAITIAVKQGGEDPTTNSALRLAVQKAKDANMPKDKIAKAISKVGEGESLIEVSYEFYGPGGAAVIVNCLTDNKNRTAAEVRAVLSKLNIQLGEQGSASYIFKGDAPSFTVELNESDLNTLQNITNQLEQLDDTKSVITNVSNALA